MMSTGAVVANTFTAALGDGLLDVEIDDKLAGTWADLFIPTSISCTVTPTIPPLGGRLAGLGLISNPPHHQ